MRLRTPLWTALLLATLLVTVSVAEARKKHHRFVGPHPIHKTHDGGFCYIEVEHIHTYAPEHDVLFRAHGEASLFVGDPAPFEYDGPKHSYYGPHPIVVGAVTRWDDDEDDTVYCYLDGGHWHGVRPTVSAEATFEVKDGIYFYLGAFPQAYYEVKPRYVRANAYYKPIRYTRPVVVVEPPPAWHGDVVVGVGVEVRGPEVFIPEPVVEVHAPSVEAGAHIHAGTGVGVRGGAGVIIRAPVVEVRPPSLEISGGVHIGIGGGAVVGGSSRPRSSTVVVVPGKTKHGHGHGHGKLKAKGKGRFDD